MILNSSLRGEGILRTVLLHPFYFLLLTFLTGAFRARSASLIYNNRLLSINFVTDTAATTLPFVRATKFEFEKRFWIICAIYFVGFFLSVFDHASFIAALRHLIAPSITPDSVDAATFARVVIAIGALLVFLSAALRTWGAAYLRTAVVHDTAQHSDALVADGPFRYTRNPLYLATLPMAAGIGVFASGIHFSGSGELAFRLPPDSS